MSRNKDRINSNIPPQAMPEMVQQMTETVNPFNFIVPTEVVDLPSKGKYYPEGHPLKNVDSIEIKHMTAKEEDILTSQSLIKKGLAITKLLQSVMVDKSIRVNDLLIGDKNALLVASRVHGYGSDYSVNLTCPKCFSRFDTVIDLSDLGEKELTFPEDVSITESGTFETVLPKSGFKVEFRLLTSADEMKLSKEADTGSTGLLKLIIVSINDQTDRFFIERALMALPIKDSSLLKKAYASVMPDIDMSCDVECENCLEESKMEVPLTAEFFWPDL